MNTDIRLLVSFRGHRKRKRLKLRLGAGSTDYLIDLWLSAAEDRPEGILYDWDETDIALAADWPGEPSELVEALLECKWLDYDNGTYSLHDWEEHQSWASGAKARSLKAKKAAAARWEKRLGKSKNATSNAQALPKDAQSNAPSPSPSPSPSVRDTDVSLTLSEKPPKTKKPLEHEADAYRLSALLRSRILINNEKAKTPKDLRKWAEDIDKMIRLDNRTPEEVENMIYFSQQDTFWQTNILSAGKLRDQFDQLWLKAKNGKQKTGSTTTAKNIETLREFVHGGVAHG
jgi:hypothetical protein